jgi:hypothetical protein
LDSDLEGWSLFTQTAELINRNIASLYEELKEPAMVGSLVILMESLAVLTKSKRLFLDAQTRWRQSLSIE